MKVCMFVKNSFEYDARVTKEAKTLVEAGHDVTVIAIHVPGVTAEREVTADGIRVVRISRMHFGLGTLNRFAARYAGSIETRHARLTGEPVDAERAQELATLMPASTATPGDRVVVDIPDQPVAGTQAATGPRLVWAAASTTLLRLAARGARLAFRVVKALVGRQGRALKTWAINRRMIQEGLASRADVYHCHDLNTLYVGTVCKRRTGARLVYDSHELATERNRMGFWWKQWATWNERRGIPHADAIIVASYSWVDILVERYRGIPRPVPIINVPEIAEPRPRDLRGELGIPPEPTLLLYQGSIQENRGIEQAIDAVAGLDGCTLVVVGYGYHRPALETEVRRRRLTDRVYFFGPIPNHELLDYTAAADIGMCNIVNSSLSYYTSMPNKLFEYMMAGIAVIGSDSPEIGRVVREEGIGEVCDPSDAAAIAAAVRRITDDAARLADLKAASRRAATRWNWSVERSKLLDVYRTMDSQAKRR